LNAATGFKRLGLVLAAAFVLGGGALWLAGYLISADAVRQQVVAEIRAVTGLNPVLRGGTKVSLFPSGSVSFDDVVLGDPEHPALSAERLTARLRLFSMLTGSVQISDVSLERPRISVQLNNDGGSNWSGLIETLTKSQQAGAPHIAAFSEMRIENGTIIIRDAHKATIETLRDVEVSLAWPSISKSFGATGRVVWHDEPLDLSVGVSDFPAALAGNRSGVKVRVSSVPLKAAFDGTISTKPTLKVEGTVGADAPSLRSALVWAGLKPMPGGGFGRFSLKAQTNVVAGTINMSGVNVELDGNSAEGVLTFATDGRQALQGTLAADALDLSPYVSTVRLLTANQREWDNARITLDGLSGIDLDLRLSAAKVALQNARLGRTAIAANLRGGHLTVSVGEAQAYGGVIKGSVALGNFESGVDLKSQMLFSDVDLESCLGQLFGLKRLEGKGNISFQLDGIGESVLAVTRTLNGTANLVGTKGALVGLNVEQLLRRLERRPLSGGGEFRNGSTPYERIAVSLKIAQGTATVDDVKLDGAAVKLTLGGTASIPARDLDLKGTASLVSATKTDAQPFELPFIVQGNWDDPIMLPDAEALIRRSGAAAPLLEKLRDRGASNTVRSVIERLTGGNPGAGAAAPAVEQAAPAQKP
jgi:AsmA protein